MGTSVALFVVDSNTVISRQSGDTARFSDRYGRAGRRACAPNSVAVGPELVLHRHGDLDWIEADGYYARIWVGVRSHLLRQSLSQLERTLDAAQFVRVHRSALVNAARVASIRKTGLARCAAQLSTGTSVPLSRERKGELHQILRRRA
jgi:two-component system LytT family response regulator